MIRHRPKGFTLIELIVVVASIAILTGIVVFAFGSWRTSIAITEMKNELTNAASAAKMYRNTSTTASFPASLAAMSYAPSANVTLTYTRRGDTFSYCMRASSVAVPTTTSYYIDSAITINPTTTACS